MRAVREQPRLAAARIIGVICLVVAGVAIGKSLNHGDTDQLHATQLRLVRAQRLLAGSRSQLRTANDRAARVDAAAQRAGALARSNRRIAARADAGARRARARVQALERSNRRIAARADAVARRARAQARALARSNRRMRDELAAVRRARRQTKSKPPT